MELILNVIQTTTVILAVIIVISTLLLILFNAAFVNTEKLANSQKSMHWVTGIRTKEIADLALPQQQINKYMFLLKTQTIAIKLLLFFIPITLGLNYAFGT